MEDTRMRSRVELVVLVGSESRAGCFSEDIRIVFCASELERRTSSCAIHAPHR